MPETEVIHMKKQTITIKQSEFAELKFVSRRHVSITGYEPRLEKGEIVRVELNNGLIKSAQVVAQTITHMLLYLEN